MLINEVSKATNLTKKAIEYYTNQDLVFSEILENGYKYFSKNDVELFLISSSGERKHQ